jgi:MSHA pilin protein MshA
MRKINKQAGFTLIELIMVIVILGVLSAFALPRFADLGGQARTATISGVVGAMKAASNIAHAQFLAQGSTGVVSLEGVTITMTDGYPDVAGIMDAANITAADFTILLGVVTAKGATTAANCKVTYAVASGVTPPTIVAVTTGC